LALHHLLHHSFPKTAGSSPDPRDQRRPGLPPATAATLDGLGAAVMATDTPAAEVLAG
jgi:hypothetical protein